ncbi:MAG: hypothetical protein AABW67_01685 [Nanoarchaeota archaeon]
MKNYIINQLKGSLSNNENTKLFKFIIEDIGKYVPSETNRVLDIASDKDPVFSGFMAKLFPNSRFVHFKDSKKILPIIHKRYSRIPNLEIINNPKDLDGPYDFGIAFLTLHELYDPVKSLKETYKRIKNNGKIFIIDYDLTWFPKIVKRGKWKNRTAMKIFEKYIFNTENEKKVLWDEINCMENHSKKGLEDYIEYCKKAGFTLLEAKSHRIKTPWGEKPKVFSYIGEKNV